MKLWSAFVTCFSISVSATSLSTPGHSAPSLSSHQAVGHDRYPAVNAQGSHHPLPQSQADATHPAEPPTYEEISSVFQKFWGPQTEARKHLVFWCGASSPLLDEDGKPTGYTQFSNATAVQAQDYADYMTRKDGQFYYTINNIKGKFAKSWIAKDVPWNEAKPVWERMSQVMAELAIGDAYAYASDEALARPYTVWNRIERKALERNNVKIHWIDINGKEREKEPHFEGTELPASPAPSDFPEPSLYRPFFDKRKVKRPAPSFEGRPRPGPPEPLHSTLPSSAPERSRASSTDQPEHTPAAAALHGQSTSRFQADHDVPNRRYPTVAAAQGPSSHYAQAHATGQSGTPASGHVQAYKPDTHTSQSASNYGSTSQHNSHTPQTYKTSTPSRSSGRTSHGQKRRSLSQAGFLDFMLFKPDLFEDALFDQNDLANVLLHSGMPLSDLLF